MRQGRARFCIRVEEEVQLIFEGIQETSLERKW